MKRTMAIEDALIWTYRDELPKTPRLRTGPMLPERAWASVEEFAELLTVIDEPVNGFGVLEDGRATVGPHPDALAIHAAVVRLGAEMEVTFPPDWSPISDLGDLGELGDLAVAKAVHDLQAARVIHGNRLRWSPQVVVVRAAIIARDPDWEIEPVEVVEVKSFGKPKWFRMVTIPDPYCEGSSYSYETDGYDPKRKRPFPDAYKKATLDHDLASGIVDRAVYEIWRAALDLLFEELQGTLESITLTPSTRPWRPWEGDEPAGPRVLLAESGGACVTSNLNQTSGAA